jgi:2-keto-3-deoxy-L-rhamnonate aldolase RhmA
MDDNGFRARMLRGDRLVGTFLKTPSHMMIEVLAMSGLDFVCLDAEHAPFGRAGMDACLAMARALGFPCLVRVPEGTPARILMALDAGAVGVVVPHVATARKAAEIVKAARFGHGGRGFAGSTRWAGFGARPMSEVLAMDAETIVIGQIEEPEGVAAIDAIAGTPGLDGVFVGPADLAVCLGKTDASDPAVRAAISKVSAAARKHGTTCITFAGSAAPAAELAAMGVSMFFIASEHAWVLAGARQAAAEVHAAGQG